MVTDWTGWTEWQKSGSGRGGRRMRRRVTFGMLAASGMAIAGGGLLAACGEQSAGANGEAGAGSTAKDQASDRPIVIVDSFGSTGLDPVVDGTSLIKWAVAEPLARVSRKGEIEPLLASSWKALDPQRWEIKIREGVTFWDGTPLDAAAVKASLERSMAKNASARAQLGATGIDVVDSRTLRVTTASVNAAFPSVLASRDIAIHNAKAADAMGDEAFARQPVLTGPFKPVEFKKSEVTTVVRNDAYWGGKPAVSRIQIKLVGDANTRLLALQSGDADMAMNLTNEAIAGLRKQPGIRLLETLGGAQEFIVLNPRIAPFDDPLVRRAFSLGIDRKPLVDKVLAGTVEVAGDVYAPIYPWAMKNLYSTDTARVAKLLDEAGWRAGSDGIRQKNGKPLAVTTLWYPQRTDLLPIGIAIQAQLKTLGFKIELKQVEQIGPAVKANDWHAAIYYNNTASSGDPQYLLDTFFKTGAPSGFGYTNQEMDRLIEQIRTTLDSAERLKLVRKAQEFLAQEVVMVPLVVKKEIFAVNDRLKKAQPPHPVSIYVLDASFNR